MSSLPRAMTGGELADIRADGQSSRLFLWAYKPPSVYTAQINQTFTTLDKVAQITYDTGVGTLANVLPGMTMYIGSAPGLYDVGMCRIRKNPSGTIFYIGEESELALADNLYLTVVDFFGLWPRHVSLDASNVPFMDFDIAYSDQHTKPNPVPCIGPRLIPVFLTGATVIIAFDGSPSWILDATVLSFVWTAPGASATSGLTTATPSITYNAAGTYRVKVTVTSTNGKSTDAYAYVRVFTTADPPINQFDLGSCTGSWSSGGWQTKVTLWAQGDFASVIDRSMCVLFSRDFYGSTEVSLSPVAGRENIVTEGWIDAESMIEDPDGSTLDFTFETAHAYLNKITGFAVGIRNINGTSSKWTNWKNLTIDDSFYHLLFWQATVIPVMDVFPTNDTRISPEQSVPGSMTIWAQITYLITNTILAKALCDRYGRMFAEIDADLLPVASRASIPVVMTLTKKDWQGQAKLTRFIVPPTSRMAASGVAQPAGGTPAAFFSLAPGHVFGQYGKSTSQDRLLLSDQITANVLAALMVARDNHLYNFSFDLAGNNRMVDIVPHQFVTVNIVAGDTPRGIVFSGHMLVREVQIAFSEGNFLQITWQGENETFPGNSTNGDVPHSAAMSTLPPLILPPLPTLPPIVLPTPVGPTNNAVFIAPGTGIVYTQNLLDASPHYSLMNAGLPPAWITANFLSRLEVTATGRLYLHCIDGFNSDPTLGIWTAPALGAPWVPVLTLAHVRSDYGITSPGSFPLGDAQIHCMGINPNAEDEVVAICGHCYANHFFLVGNIYTGSSSGMSIGAGIGVNIPDQQGNIFGPMMYGSGNYDALYDSGDTFSCLVSRGGGLGSQTDVGNLLHGIPNMTRAGVDGLIIYIFNNGVGIEKSIDGGVSYSNLLGVPANVLAMASDPSGLFLLAQPNIGALQSCADGGVTWGATPFVPKATGIRNLGTITDWLLSTIDTQIYTTPDFAATFVNKNGDIAGVLGAGVQIKNPRNF